MRIMLLRDPHTLMAKQYRDSFNGHTGKKQFDSECVAETVCMSVRNACEFEESAQSRLPASHDAFQLPSSAPKEKIRKDCVNGNASLLRVQEESVAFDPICAEVDSVSDAHATVTK